MAYTLSNKCAKNCCKRTILVQVIIEDVVAFFLEHSVVGVVHCSAHITGLEIIKFSLQIARIYITMSLNIEADCLQITSHVIVQWHTHLTIGQLFWRRYHHIEGQTNRPTNEQTHILTRVAPKTVLGRW